MKKNITIHTKKKKPSKMKNANLTQQFQNVQPNINQNNNQIGTDNSFFRTTKDGQYVYKHWRKRDDSTFNKDPKRCMCINYKSINDFNTYDRCTNNALDNSEFCQLHQDCSSYLRQFLSGSEYDNDIQLWADPLVEGSHNCYSYFLNRQVKAVKEKCGEICNKNFKNVSNCIDNSGCTDLKPQPGDFTLIKRTGSDRTKKRIYKCPEMQQKILSDNPTVFPVMFNQKCPNGYYKGAMVVDSIGSEEGNTYHFYKQMKDGTFFHKPGINPVSYVDSPFKGEKGRKIYIPHFANRDYSKDSEDPDDDGIFYNGFCGYYCIPRNEKFHKNLV